MIFIQLNWALVFRSSTGENSCSGQGRGVMMDLGTGIRNLPKDFPSQTNTLGDI